MSNTAISNLYSQVCPFPCSLLPRRGLRALCPENRNSELEAVLEVILRWQRERHEEVLGCPDEAPGFCFWAGRLKQLYSIWFIYFFKTLLNLDSCMFLAGHGYNSFKCIDGAGDFYLGCGKVLWLEGHTRGWRGTDKCGHDVEYHDACIGLWGDSLPNCDEFRRKIHVQLLGGRGSNTVSRLQRGGSDGFG